MTVFSKKYRWALLLIFLAVPSLQAAEGPKVLLAILARNKAHVLPLYLQCIEQLDYEKKLITVYINTNNNCDDTKSILENWVRKNKSLYAEIVFDWHEEAKELEIAPHDWTPQRWDVLAQIRNKSLQKTKEYNCEYYFVVDCDNFIIPCTLKTLISKNKPIIAPLLKAIPEEENPFRNFFAAVNSKGYYQFHPDYFKIINYEIKGTFLVPVVHQVYLVDAKYIDKLTYTDGSHEWEFIIFSRSARQNGVGQYICNERCFGTFLHFCKNPNPTLEEEQEVCKRINILVPELFTAYR